MAYATVSEVADWLGIQDSYDDSLLSVALASAEDAVDDYCGWRFDSASATYTYSVASTSLLDLDALPLASSSGITLSTDDNDDGTFENTWSASWFQLEPLNGVGPNGRTGWPYTQVRPVGGYWFPTSSYGRPTVQIAGTFGWAAVPDNVRLATIQMAGWLWSSKASPSGVLLTEFGPVSVRQVPQAERLLRNYRRGRAIVGMG